MTVLTYEMIEWAGQKLPLLYTTEGLCYVGALNETWDEVRTSFKVSNDYQWCEATRESEYARQLYQYLDGERQEFEVCIDWLNGTTFQREVWQALQQIPYGETRSYSDIAVLVGRPKATRAVGTAIGNNPLTIVVPCHRVLTKAGTIGGFRGGLAMKQQLLALEQVK